jgi:hypothetical protein
VNGYDQSEANFAEYAQQVEEFLGRPLSMNQQLGWTRFRDHLAKMDISFINMLDKGGVGTGTRVDEKEVAKHLAIADFLSDVFLERIAESGRSTTGAR